MTMDATKIKFTPIAKRIFKQRFPDAVELKSYWTGKSNVFWSTVNLQGDAYGYFLVQKRDAEITGELALSLGAISG